MNIEKYSERVRGFIQSAQTMALSRNHQQFTPEHLLKVLLDDEEGLAASLIERAGGDAKAVQLGVEAALATLPQGRGRQRPALSGAAAGQGLRDRRGDRQEGRRQLRHGRAAADRARRREVGQDRRHPGQGRRHARRR